MMKSLRHIFGIALLFLTSSVTLQAQQTVIISELFYDTPFPEGIGTSRSGEFVSLYNYGETAVSISGWRLVNENKGRDAFIIPKNTLKRYRYYCSQASTSL